jgi:hypothetical protein
MSSKFDQRSAMVQQITGASRHEAIILKRLMGETILHSTLDWLSPEDFARAAREAYQLFKLAPAYFHTQQAYLAGTYKRMQAEARLERANANKDPQAIAKTREQLDLCRWQENHLAEICQRLGKAYFPSENA